MPRGADNPEKRVLGQRLEKSIDTLMRSQTPNEQNSVTLLSRIGRIPSCVRATVDDARARRRRVELVGGIRGDGEKEIEQSR